MGLIETTGTADWQVFINLVNICLGAGILSGWRDTRPRHITLSGARSRLYQRRFSRPNTHFSAFFEIYKNIIFSRGNFAKFCKNLAKFAGEKVIFLEGLKNAEKCVFGRENRR